MKIIETVLLASLCSSAFGRLQIDFRCKIERISLVDNSPGLTYSYNSRFLGREFAVDRRTGAISGVLKHPFNLTPEVIEYGGDGNSFVAIGVMRPHEEARRGIAYMLTIRNWKSIGPLMPFVYMEETNVFSGNCTRF